MSYEQVKAYVDKHVPEQIVYEILPDASEEDMEVFEEGFYDQYPRSERFDFEDQYGQHDIIKMNGDIYVAFHSLTGSFFDLEGVALEEMKDYYDEKDWKEMLPALKDDFDDIDEIYEDDVFSAEAGDEILFKMQRVHGKKIKLVMEAIKERDDAWWRKVQEAEKRKIDRGKTDEPKRKSQKKSGKSGKKK